MDVAFRRPATDAERVRVPLDSVVTHHWDGLRSGVARFNTTLARQLGVPLHGVDELPRLERARPLLSFKVCELGPAHERHLEAYLARAPLYEVFLHEYDGRDLERRLVTGAQRVHCGNAEIEAAVRPLHADLTLLWSPGHVGGARIYPQADLSVFTFGMAHKIRIDVFARLKQLLDRTRRSYAVYVSASNHETASLRDSESIVAEMTAVFPETLYFLGTLSDEAVYNQLRRTTFFAAFFQHGVRANNSSVSAAMEHGAVVLTNLDEHSPPEYEHMRNLVDVTRCDELPLDSTALAGIGSAARDTARARGWPLLIDRLR